MSTKVFGILGWPIKQSASPAMMTATFRYLGIDAAYVPFPVQPSRLEAALRGIVALGIQGVNVTIPHKQNVLALVQETSDVAKLAGAVNLLRVDATTGEISAHNSDVIGWWKSIESHMTPFGQTVTLLGAGGGARGIVTGLALYAPQSKVKLVARNIDQLHKFQSDFGNYLSIEPIIWDKRHDAVHAADVVINATPIGMWPNDKVSPLEDPNCFRAGQVVQDIIYRPLRTRLLSQAESRGAVALDGLWMLVYQGAVALDYWLGVEAPIDVMRQAALEFVGAN